MNINKNELLEIQSYKFDIKKSPVDERDYVAETIYVSEDDGLPDELDLREDMLSPRNQGRQGSCAAMASSAMKEWQERQDVGLYVYMSPQFIYNSRENLTTGGMYSRDVMKILSKKGSVPETEYPYETTEPITPKLLKYAAQYKIKAYAQVSSVTGLKKALIKNGPCYLAVPVYNYGARMWLPRQGDKKIGGHALCICGYTKEGFIIRNSWGLKWNGDGHTVFPYGDWGLHWEVWTTIDDESGTPLPKPKKKGFWEKVADFFKGIFG